MATKEECDADYYRALREAPPERSSSWAAYWLNWFMQPTPTAGQPDKPSPEKP